MRRWNERVELSRSNIPTSRRRGARRRVPREQALRRDCRDAVFPESAGSSSRAGRSAVARKRRELGEARRAPAGRPGVVGGGVSPCRSRDRTSRRWSSSGVAVIISFARSVLQRAPPATASLRAGDDPALTLPSPRRVATVVRIAASRALTAKRPRRGVISDAGLPAAPIRTAEELACPRRVERVGDELDQRAIESGRPSGRRGARRRGSRRS